MERKPRVGRQNRTSERSDHSHGTSRRGRWLLTTLWANLQSHDCPTNGPRHIQRLSIFTYLLSKKK